MALPKGEEKNEVPNGLEGSFHMPRNKRNEIWHFLLKQITRINEIHKHNKALFSMQYYSNIPKNSETNTQLILKTTLRLSKPFQTQRTKQIANPNMHFHNPVSSKQYPYQFKQAYTYRLQAQIRLTE